MLIIQTGPEDYLIAGRGAVLTFAPLGDGPSIAGIDTALEECSRTAISIAAGRSMATRRTSSATFSSHRTALRAAGPTIPIPRSGLGGRQRLVDTAKGVSCFNELAEPSPQRHPLPA